MDSWCVYESGVLLDYIAFARDTRRFFPRCLHQDCNELSRDPAVHALIAGLAFCK